MRILALFLGFGTIPAIAAPVLRPAFGSDSLPYADWLRSQLRAPVSDALSSALSRASETRHRSMGEFVSAFIDAYEAESARDDLAVAFVGDQISDEALFLYLQFRYQRLVGDALLPRSVLQALVSASGPTTQRALSSSLHDARHAYRTAWMSAKFVARNRGILPSTRDRIPAAQPQGP